MSISNRRRKGHRRANDRRDRFYEQCARADHDMGPAASFCLGERWSRGRSPIARARFDPSYVRPVGVRIDSQGRAAVQLWFRLEEIARGRTRRALRRKGRAARKAKPKGPAFTPGRCSMCKRPRCATWLVSAADPRIVVCDDCNNEALRVVGAMTEPEPELTPAAKIQARFRRELAKR